MNRLLRMLTLAMGLVAVAGCGRIYHHTSFPAEAKPIALGSDLGVGRQYTLVRPFHEEERQIFFFFHNIPLNQASGIKAAEKHLHEGDGVANLRIHTYYGPVDLFFTLITGGIITTYTIDTHGDVVKLAEVPPRT
jgi:hypothetical protein